MPVRIKPKLALDPCVLNLDSIKGITSLVQRDFPQVRFSASSGIWEVYDEQSRDDFIKAIAEKETLDAFEVVASASGLQQLELKFTASDAQIAFIGGPSDLDRHEHFLFDLKKHILKPTALQVAAWGFADTRWLAYLRLPFLMVPLNLDSAAFAPYTKIIIHQRQPNRFLEGISINLISTVIWTFIVFLVGLITAYLAIGQTK